METIKIKVGDIKPYERNAKKHDERQIKNVMESIKQFGLVQPLVVDKDNVLIIGHCRLIAAKRLKMREVDCIRAEELTQEQVDKLRLLDNKLNESEWDMDLLLEDIPELDFSDFDIDWGLPEVDDPTENIQEDEPPELPEEAKAIVGDIYEFGGVHRLICGDSTDVAVIDRLMDGVKADMVFTDPPYGYNYQSNMRTKTEKFDVLENDDKILDFFPNLLGRVKGFVMICTTWKVLDKWLPLFKQYFDLSNVIIWDKGGGGIGDLKHTFSTDYEVILCANNGEEIREKRIGSVWSIGKDNANDYEHPTQKPVELSANAIRHTTDKGQVILDCFGGSGSTLIACEQLNRKCYMCELDPHYIDVIVQRYINFKGTDEDVFLIRDGQRIPYKDVR